VRDIRGRGVMESRAALRVRMDALRADGKERRIVLANGCFDLVHASHVRYLAGARRCGDFLVVALNSDESVRALKGPQRPFMPLVERAEIVGALRSVDAVTWFDEPDLEATLLELRPDIHAKGADYTPETVAEARVDARLGIQIAICGNSSLHSSTELLARLNNSTARSRFTSAEKLRTHLT
jgi:D-glycero-beta-D-manno-heptose 1-phosphate adenylyltransferase